MSEIAIFSDSHFGARRDSQFFQDYFFRFYSEVFFPELKKRNIKTIIHAGDWMDSRKYTNHQVLKQMRRDVINPIIDNDIKVILVEGNHDQYYNNTNKLDTPTELFGHIPNFEIYKDPAEYQIDNLKILLLPWITEENRELSLDLIKNSNSDICVGHLELNGFEMMRGQVMSDGLDPKLFEKYDRVFSGHFHHKSEKGNISYLGSPYEITWMDYDDPRGFHILNTETLEVEFIQNPFRMFFIVYYDDFNKTLDTIIKQSNLDRFSDKYVKVIVKNRCNPYYFDKFLDALYKKNPLDITILEDFIYETENTEEELSSSEDTLSLLLRFTEDLQTSTDKNKIKEELKSLYNEALQI